MQAFLKRHYKKGSRVKTGHTEVVKVEGPWGVRKYHDAVSKSMDSLLMVASSVPLPSEAKLSVDSGSSESSGHKPRRPEAPASHFSDQDLSSMDRRYSCDLSVEDFSDDEDDNDDNRSDAGLSRSLEASPLRTSRVRNSDSTDSRETFQLLRHSLLATLGQSASLTSDRETDSDDDLRFSAARAKNRERLISGSMDTLTRTTDQLANEDPSLKPRSNALMDHPFFLLEVRLREGKDLVVRDSCGTSDPYVKFKVGGKQVYKSRIVYKNLNPRWDETFTIPVDDVQKPVNVKVFDHDRALYDDPMGSADIDLSQLELEKPSELKLMLSDRGKSDYMGYLVLTCTLTPKTQEDKDQFLRRSVRSMESSKKLKLQSWSGVLTVTLVDGWNLLSMDDNGLSDPYVKFKLGNEKYRSRHKSKTLNPRWLEQFDLRLFDDQSMQLEISVYDHDVTGKDDFMGRATIDLSQLEPEVTHTIEQELEDGGGMVRLLLTMSGTSRGDASSDLCNFTPISRDLDDICRKYSLLRSFKNMSDVGYLQVIVYRAVGLKSADFGGQSDPFCVLELVNARVQTHTEYKTLNPEWSKVFTFKVRDIHSVLEVTVYDEDRDKKVEFLGKVAIPLLRVRSGEVQWYALKDKKLMHREKGSIQLKIDFVFNHVKAAIRTVNPAEEKFMQIEPKFRINTMKRNVDRVSQLIGVLLDGGRFLQSCFSWESTSRSATAFIAFLVIVWNFELYMLPISLLLIFLKNMLVAQVVGALKREPVEEDTNDDDDDEEEEDKDKEEKKTFKEKLQSIQDVCLKVQETMDMVACLGERIKKSSTESFDLMKQSAQAPKRNALDLGR
ncbi:hypothetical protein C0Q70_20548 [Pomacea canaliculata]|uniref:C2 domain-containing protein n=1 Tax=Pomacea canaliculata TaxID=400727 RepID=A0A2T7NFV1_POMCA|nr:hypothetical protein C0Q70_20548 [Pomacea canaliculata]